MKFRWKMSSLRVCVDARARVRWRACSCAWTRVLSILWSTQLWYKMENKMKFRWTISAIQLCIMFALSSWSLHDTGYTLPAMNQKISIWDIGSTRVWWQICSCKTWARELILGRTLKLCCYLSEFPVPSLKLMVVITVR